MAQGARIKYYQKKKKITLNNKDLVKAETKSLDQQQQQQQQQQQ